MGSNLMESIPADATEAKNLGFASNLKLISFNMAKKRENINALHSEIYKKNQNIICCLNETPYHISLEKYGLVSFWHDGKMCSGLTVAISSNLRSYATCF